ncbi:NUDIX hydrolase [soil metagenome]
MTTARTARRVPPATPAAGGVVWRYDGSQLLVALVHRPRYDDWSLPKGKLNAREHPLLGAIREVEEETGAQVTAGRRLASVYYPLGEANKRVSYWAMRYERGEHTPSREVDEISWLTPAEATRRLSYSIDRGVLADFARLPADGTTILVQRHAKAGKRSAYAGDDRLRPLDKIGRRQARDAVALLAAFSPEHVISADRVRCEQTVAPLCAALGITQERSAAFSDEAYLADNGPGMQVLRGLAAARTTTVICSQGKAIPAMLADLEVPGAEFPARKGSLWALTVVAGRVAAGDYYAKSMY